MNYVNMRHPMTLRHPAIMGSIQMTSKVNFEKLTSPHQAIGVAIFLKKSVFTVMGSIQMSSKVTFKKFDQPSLSSRRCHISQKTVIYSFYRVNGATSWLLRNLNSSRPVDQGIRALEKSWHRSKFSKVTSLLSALCRITEQLTFENLWQWVFQMRGVPHAAGNLFWKVSCTVVLYSKLSSKLTFENLFFSECFKCTACHVQLVKNSQI